MSPPLIVSLVALLAALVTFVQGLRMLTATHRLRDGLTSDKDLLSGLEPGRAQDELRRSIEWRTLELVVLVNRPPRVLPIVVAMVFVAYLVVVGTAVYILEASSVPVVLAGGCVVVCAVLLVGGELVRAHRDRNVIRSRLGLPARVIREPKTGGRQPD